MLRCPLHSNLIDDIRVQDEDQDSESPDPPAIAPGGRLDLMTAAVVRLLGASTAQLKSWQDLQDVLQDDADSDQAEPPTAVALQPAPAAGHQHTAAAAAAAAVADVPEVGQAVKEAQEVSQHFEDLKISSRGVTWWGRKGLMLLAAAVERRLERYPASLEDDRLALQQHQKQRQRQQQQGEGGDGVVAAEHAAAVGAALQLRVCEQEALREVLDQVELLLGSG